MPAKKKGKKKGKGGKKKKKDDATLELEDKYQRTVNEIEALKDHLAIRKELSRKAHGNEDEMKNRMKETEKVLEEHKSDQKAINADMTRQYKTMQTEMGLRIHKLETDLLRTRQQLATTEADLKKTKEEKERITKEKDEEIDSLNMKIVGMEKDYERILDETLDSLIAKIDAAKDKWEEKATLVQVNNKHVLVEFGLNPLEL
ncbi:coiled-coil domain-containing protein 153-like isoform X2 [Ruditapes philippinarum]|uniref:coiled-coil domain-containing protein 153-like isoform X1 n=1 Tax=Ruditapes philippinarum TaxID=129788 RepID=UPI00295A969C|nr:coiled-coil domain-containing protein 153-like isoform X1 [Ruditapes philippinarum]XP_060579918.1 coiled-coil domain-containing protein 153-like isoform X2 [Ruditapes philippinarum]